jgi:hypothetical protein
VASAVGLVLGDRVRPVVEPDIWGGGSRPGNVEQFEQLDRSPTSRGTASQELSGEGSPALELTRELTLGAASTLSPPHPLPELSGGATGLGAG